MARTLWCLLLTAAVATSATSDGAQCKCSTLGSARRNCGGSISYAKRETTPKVRLEPKK
eukprot:COSAG06_NODE_32823_length_499_cov_2.390000_1_plen_58_part_01